MLVLMLLPLYEGEGNAD